LKLLVSFSLLTLFEYLICRFFFLFGTRYAVVNLTLNKIKKIKVVTKKIKRIEEIKERVMLKEIKRIKTNLTWY